MIAGKCMQATGEMESENESNCGKEIVKDLQTNLFPSTPKKSNFFSNFLFKTIAQDDNDEKLKTTYPNRDLYTINKDYSFIPQSPRWPTECQVLNQRIQHIYYVPTNPEPYYRPTGNEAQPPPVGDECGTIVYQYNPISAVNYFSRSSVGGGRYIQSPTVQHDFDEDSLQFESRFECGNLEKAIRITSNYYELYLRADFYTNRHMQWFYFRITNTKRNFMYRFSIVNFTKDGSLFSEGMRPLMYSTKDAQIHSIGWRRFGDNITYYSNDNVSPDDPDAQMTYTLTFTTEFPHDNDEVYFAPCYPYTYSDLEDYLHELANHPVKSAFTTVRLLCKSLAGNNVHHVTITTPQAEQIKRKPAVVITARVHPGETPSSWLMKGFLDYLTSDCSIAKELRDRFIFKLIPMLNPDGVIVGNNRCSLTGKDLNRQYKSVIREQYPTICYTKMLIKRLLDECGIALYCDLHAHSRKHNIFIYGCEKQNNNSNNEYKLQEQVFPLLLHKNTADKFCFESCKFKVQKSKEGTGRVVMWMLGIQNSYTMEASFAGSTLGGRNLTHFNVHDFEQMAKTFCQTLLDLYDDTPRKEKLRYKIITKLIQYGSNADEPTNIDLSEYSSDEGDTSSSSSNEAGHNYSDDSRLIIAPPPTPIVNQKTTKKPKIKKKNLTKSPNLIRKPLPICKATLGLSFLSLTNPYISDSSDSDDNNNEDYKDKQKIRLKRRKSKKLLMKKTKQYTNDSQLLFKQTQSISVCELLPTDQIRNESVIKRPKTPQLKFDRRNIVTQQLSQVQAKLLSLKNKLWFGVRVENQGLNVPLSFNSKKSSGKSNKTKKCKKMAKVVKTKEETIKNGLRRQTAIDLDENLKIKKSTSLPTIKQLSIKNKQLNSCGSLVKTFLNCTINDDNDKETRATIRLKQKKKKSQKGQKS